MVVNADYMWKVNAFLLAFQAHLVVALAKQSRLTAQGVL